MKPVAIKYVDYSMRSIATISSALKPFYHSLQDDANNNAAFPLRMLRVWSVTNNMDWDLLNMVGHLALGLHPFFFLIYHFYWPASGRPGTPKSFNLSPGPRPACPSPPKPSLLSTGPDTAWPPTPHFYLLPPTKPEPFTPTSVTLS